jgi:hypothetical protein
MSVEVIAFNPTDAEYEFRAYYSGTFHLIIDITIKAAGDMKWHYPADPASQMNGEVEPEETDRVGALLLEAIKAAPTDENLQSPYIRDFAEFLVHCKGYCWR